MKNVNEQLYNYNDIFVAETLPFKGLKARKLTFNKNRENETNLRITLESNKINVSNISMETLTLNLSNRFT